MNRSYRVATWILAIVGVGVALVSVIKNPAPLAFATVAAGVVTFFHFLADSPDPQQGQQPRDARLRAAIASALVVQYLVLVGLVAYFTNADAFAKLLPITETLLASFTATVGVVIAFYFGSSAYVEGKRVERGSDVPEPKNDSADTK